MQDQHDHSVHEHAKETPINNPVQSALLWGARRVRVGVAVRPVVAPLVDAHAPDRLPQVAQADRAGREGEGPEAHLIRKNLNGY